VVYFDGSWNAFGNLRDGQFGAKMAEACNNGYLKHVDISYNSMDEKDCKEFGEGIHDNHTLWGLHIMGNDCTLDSMGFVIPGQRTLISSKDILLSPSQDGRSLTNLNKKASNAKVKAYQKCWVCEGWSEAKFEWRMGQSSAVAKQPVYIHFDFDNYKPWLMTRQDDEVWVIWKMIPPGKSHYFFSLGGEHGEAEAARDHKVERRKMPKVLKDLKFVERGAEEKPVEFYENFTLHKLNYVTGKHTQVLDGGFEPKKFEVVVPRLSDELWQRPIRPRTPWSFPISIFKDYQIDTDEKLMECFEFDWSCMRNPIKSEEEKAAVKEELRKGYKTM